ncbi:LysM peptidoglycan-binding domain-containing protein [Streptacidiphilus sp. EB129]|uniref:LysM peptidoglycan-binding domain-containing protein n=1 Tax=Streptacidiphilus sp. EB129 TaxID=3156262 RepID=UPI003510DAE4
MTNRPLAALRALTALLLLAVLLAGTPIALLRLGVLPAQWPTWAQTTHALTGPDNGQLFLGAITLLGWCAWASFTLSLAVETAAALRRRSAPRIAALGATQRLAALLVSSIVLLLPTTGALAATAAPASAATLHLPHATTRTPQQATQHLHATHTSTAAWSGLTHTVRPDDTLWNLAEHYLGDGMRWREIVAANQGVVQSDGSALTASTSHLTPGWTLRLPASAHVPATKAHETREGHHHTTSASQHSHTEDGGPLHGASPEHTHRVRPGETLSQIAQDDLGNADAYPTIAAASTGTLQPDGRHLTNPDHIDPGWELTIPQPNQTTPAPTAPISSTPAPAPVSGGSGSGAGSSAGNTATIPRPGTSSTSPTASPAPTSPPPAATTSPSADASAPPAGVGTATSPAPASVPQPSTPPATASDSSLPLQVGAGIAALLAAGLLTGYGVKRALQQRERRPGETIAVPDETSALEHALIHQAEPPTAELLDRALRTLAARLPTDTPLPDVDGARITPLGIQLHADADPLAPFTAGADGWWQLDPAEPLLSDEEADRVDPPYPLLAVLGRQPEHGMLLADLAQVRTVLLDGPTEQVREVARSIALDAATCPWGEQVQVMCAGITDPDLPAIVHTGRVQHLRRLSEAVQDLAELLLTAHQDADTPLPWLLVVADQADERDAWQLADLIARVPHAPIALVLAGEGLDSLFPDAPHLDCTNAQPQPSPVPDSPVVLQRVTDAEYQQLMTDLRTTEQPARPAQGAWIHVPHSVEQLEAEAAQQEAAQVPDEQAAADAGAGPGLTPFLAFTQHQASPGAGPAAVPLLPPARASITVPDADSPTADTAPDGAVPDDGDRQTELAPVPEPGQALEHHDPADPAALNAPEILVLGPLDVTGLGSSGRGRRLAEFAAYLYLRPQRTADAIAEAMDPMTPWEHRTVVARTSELRKLWGNAPDGTPYLPYVSRTATYPRLVAVRCDWTRFQRLAERGLAAGPAGTGDLESALALVRGRPFAGSNASWAMPEQQEMISRITDVAHTLAARRITTHHWDAARTAIGTGLHVNPTAEVLFRDWITLEHRRGSRTELARVITELQKALRPLNVDMQPATQALITDIYNREQHHAGSA